MTPTALSTPLLAAMLGLAIVGLPQTMVAQSEKAMKALGDRDLEIWNKGNLSLIDELYAPGYVLHNVDQLLDVEVKGAAAMKQYVTSMRTSFPDLHVRRDELIIKGDRIIVRWTATGTNTGPLPGPAGKLPPTGKHIEVSGVEVARIVKGKYAESWNYWNGAALLAQLGFNITPPSAATQK